MPNSTSLCALPPIQSHAWRPERACQSEGSLNPIHLLVRLAPKPFIARISVWASMSKTVDRSKPIVAAFAPMDAQAFLMGRAVGAQASVSSLLALLGAADAIAGLDPSVTSSLTHEIVLAAFNAETFDLTGSRAFAHDLSSFSCSKPLLDSNTACKANRASTTWFFSLDSNAFRCWSEQVSSLIASIQHSRR